MARVYNRRAYLYERWMAEILAEYRQWKERAELLALVKKFRRAS